MAPYPATYSDGKSAAVQAVRVELGDVGLRILSDTGSVEDWTWDDLRLLERASKNRPIRLSNRSRPGARLTIDDYGVIDVLRTHARYLRREPLDRARLIKLGSIAGICVAVGLFFVFGLPWLARPAASLVPVSWEDPVGESTIDLINGIAADGRPMCQNAAGVAALQKLTDRLGASLDTPYRFTVTVADSGVVNALAVPGGRIMLFRGLIKKAKSPDEVAGVLAHEMAHVVHRHPTQGMINSVGWSSLMSVFTGGASLSNEAVARLAAHLATSAYSRDLETEADEGALRILADAGIGNAGFANFFRLIQRESGGGLGLPGYMSSHPQTKDRIAAIENRPATSGTPAMTDAEWRALRAICDG